MSKFCDGPAWGAVIHLRRSPLFIRVVIDPSGEIDALDQLDDTVRPGEVVHVYRRVTKPVTGFIAYRGKDRHKSGPYSDAEYVWIGNRDTPPVHILTNNDLWGEWAKAQAEKLKESIK